jgi:hypothetical protein
MFFGSLSDGYVNSQPTTATMKNARTTIAAAAILRISSPSYGFYLRVDHCLVCSIKVEVKKKHNSNGWNFSCFAAHLMEQDLF